MDNTHHDIPNKIGVCVCVWGGGGAKPLTLPLFGFFAYDVNGNWICCCSMTQYKLGQINMTPDCLFMWRSWVRQLVGVLGLQPSANQCAWSMSGKACHLQNFYVHLDIMECATCFTCMRLHSALVWVWHDTKHLGVDLSSIIATPIWKAVNNPFEKTYFGCCFPLLWVRHLYSLQRHTVLLTCGQISDECPLFMIWYGALCALSLRV